MIEINTTEYITAKPVYRREIPQIRREIIKEKTDIRFHNHIDDRYIYGYPKVLYQSLKGRFRLVQIGFQDNDINSTTLNEKLITTKKVKNKIYESAFGKYKYKFVSPWFALTPKNFKRFKNGELQKEDYEAILTGNILSFLKGVDMWIDKQIKVDFEHLEKSSIRYKGGNYVGFLGNFKTNIKLPKYIGLGRKVSIGFGMVEKC